MDSSGRGKDPQIARWLWLSLTCWYILLLGGHIYSPDGTVMYRVTQGWVEDGTLDFPVLLDHEAFGGPVSREEDGKVTRRHSKYGLGLSAASVPAYAASRLLSPLATDEEKGIFHTPATMEGPFSWGSHRRVRDPDRRSFRRLWYKVGRDRFDDAFGAFLVTWTNGALTAGTCALLFLLLRGLGVGVRVSLGCAVACGLGSPMLHYARTFWAEPLAAFSFTGIAACLVRNARSGDRRDLVGAGGFYGLLVATKIALGILALPLGLALLHSRSWKWRDFLGDVGWITAGAAPGFAGVGAYNAVRFGSPLSTGYSVAVDAWTSPWTEGLLGLIASPGRGLLWHFPLVLVSLWAIRKCQGTSRTLSILAFSGLVTLLGLYCRWWDWGGSWCWGPRFLVPVLPLLYVPVAVALENAEGAQRRAIKAAVGLTALVAINGILVNPHDYYQWLKAIFVTDKEAWAALGIFHHFELLYWDWHFAPLLRWWTFPVRETQLLPAVFSAPGLVAGLYALVLCGVLLGVLRIRRFIPAAVTQSSQ